MRSTPSQHPLSFQERAGVRSTPGQHPLSSQERARVRLMLPRNFSRQLNSPLPPASAESVAPELLLTERCSSLAADNRIGVPSAPKNAVLKVPAPFEKEVVVIGTTVSRDKIFEHLGRGGISIVDQAQEIRLDHRVAREFLPPDLTLIASPSAGRSRQTPTEFVGLCRGCHKATE